MFVKWVIKFAKLLLSGKCLDMPRSKKYGMVVWGTVSGQIKPPFNQQPNPPKVSSPHVATFLERKAPQSHQSTFFSL